jgi:hypothetical protein
MKYSLIRCEKLVVVLFAFTCVFTLARSANAQKVRLRSKVTPVCSSGTSAWKFADIFADGNIAVQGSYNCRGAFIYDVSNPDAPVLANWYNPIRPGTASTTEQFLEAIVVGNRGYFGSGNGGGVYIVDLTNPYSPQMLGRVTTTGGNGFNSIHEMMVWQNLLIENDNNGTNLLRIVNVSNPVTPVFVRTLDPLEINWVHAMHIRGNKMYTSGWGNSTGRARTEIWDITNLGNSAMPVPILGFVEDPSSITAGNQMHSSWTSEDGSMLYSAREITNSNGPSPGDVRVYDVTNPAQPVLMNRLTMADLGLNAVTPHNPVVMGNKLYVSWYQAGLQVFDISFQQQPHRIGQYDTFPSTFAPDPEAVRSIADNPWDLLCGAEGFQNVLPTTYNGAWAVYPFLGEDKVLVGDLTEGLLILDVTKANAPAKNVVSDFDGDGKTDLSVFTPSTGLWTVEQSSDGSQTATNWGIPEDVIVAGDYDGDGKSDTAVWRPSTGTWWFIMSSNGSRPAVRFGLAGDIPVPADYDADGKTDIAVWRPSTGVWYILQTTLGFKAVQWGLNGDKPLMGDYEGDGKPDIAVWRPSNGVWYVLQSSSSIPMYATWGTIGDRPVWADFDGDLKSDFTVYRPSTGIWYILRSSTGSMFAYNFGLAEDIPMPTDFDGDGDADISVFRPSTNVWYRIDSSTGAFFARVFGQSGDRVSPASVQPE